MLCQANLVFVCAQGFLGCFCPLCTYILFVLFFNDVLIDVLDTSAKYRCHRLYSILLHRWDVLRIAIKCYRYAGMSQSFLDNFRVLIGFKQQRSAGMPQIMKPKSFR